MKVRAIIGCLLFAVCASAQRADDSAMYLQFFHEAAHRPEVPPGHPVSDASSATYVDPTMEDTLGITSDEGRALVKIALQCEADVWNLDASMRTLIFESRLELVESDKVSEAVAERLKELEAKRVHIILDSVQQMKASLGDRFKGVDDYVRTHASGGFFPVTGPTKKL